MAIRLKAVINLGYIFFKSGRNYPTSFVREPTPWRRRKPLGTAVTLRLALTLCRCAAWRAAGLGPLSLFDGSMEAYDHLKMCRSPHPLGYSFALGWLAALLKRTEKVFHPERKICCEQTFH